MSKKHKAMRQGTPIRWDALDRMKKNEATEKTAAEEAREKMLERYKNATSDNPFEEVKEPITPEIAYKYMNREKNKDVEASRSRMIERRKKQSDNNYYAGGVKQTGGANEAREEMIERLAKSDSGTATTNCDDAKQRKKALTTARNRVYKPRYKRVKK